MKKKERGATSSRKQGEDEREKKIIKSAKNIEDLYAFLLTKCRLGAFRKACERTANESYSSDPIRYK